MCYTFPGYQCCTVITWIMSDSYRTSFQSYAAHLCVYDRVTFGMPSCAVVITTIRGALIVRQASSGTPSVATVQHTRWDAIVTCCDDSMFVVHDRSPDLPSGAGRPYSSDLREHHSVLIPCGTIHIALPATFRMAPSASSNAQRIPSARPLS